MGDYQIRTNQKGKNQRRGGRNGLSWEKGKGNVPR
jgi:hypothetical protein